EGGGNSALSMDIPTSIFAACDVRGAENREPPEALILSPAGVPLPFHRDARGIPLRGWACRRNA
ncbi:hypothetical protein, partial [Acidithiobacillus ferridurans]|uniref:hypothetical protein n=1 Tax=Acidithiobacillus ferridurans TaxID=1232575 RepID=UPI001C06BD7A